MPLFLVALPLGLGSPVLVRRDLEDSRVRTCNRGKDLSVTHLDFTKGIGFGSCRRSLEEDDQHDNSQIPPTDCDRKLLRAQG
jgi:hypothetical protein